MTEGILLAACLVLAVAVGALGMAVLQLRGRLTDLERDRGSRHARPPSGPDPTPAERVETPLTSGVAEEFVITHLGEEPEPEPVATLEARLFADVVLRESVVRAASFVHGVRRALSPANRNRIWFEMRSEVKRVRKDRKAEEREAIREWRARKRASLRDQAGDAAA